MKYLIYLITLIYCVVARQITSQIIALEELSYEIIVTVKDFQGYSLSGVLINLQQGNTKLGESNLMTSSNGQVQLNGKMSVTSKSQAITITAIASTQFNDITTQGSVTQTADNSGLIKFSINLKFTQSDVAVKDVFQRGLISLSAKSNQTPLEGVDVLFTAMYSLNGVIKEVKFKATTDSKGTENVYFLLPSTGGTFIVLYTASKLEYWNTQQLNKEDANYALWPEKQYNLVISINMEPGQYKYIITALITDQASKPLQGAKLTLSGINLGNNKALEQITALSTADGKIQATMIMKATPKIHILSAITKDEYLGVETEFDQEFDLNTKKDSFTKDIGTLKLQEASGVIQISGTITDSAKLVEFVSGAQIILTTLDNIEPLKLISDASGKFKGEIHVPSGKEINIKASVTATGFVQKMAAPRPITANAKTPTLVTIDVVLDRNIIKIKIKDKLIDPQKKPISNAIVKITDSTPIMPDKTLYNKEITDKTDGSFEYDFACYENIKFTATFVFQVPDYVPVTYKTNQLDCKDNDLVQTEMTLSKQTSILTIKGQVQDVDQKPMKGIALKLKSNPIIDIPNPNLTTDQNGNWQVTNLIVIPNTKYTFTIEYTNDNKELVSIPYEYTPTLVKEQTLTFPTIGYQKFIKAKISGKIAPTDGKGAIPIALTITCNSKGRDGKPIVAQTTTAADGSYSVEIEALAGSDKPLECVVTNTPVSTAQGTSTTGNGGTSGTGTQGTSGTGTGTSGTGTQGTGTGTQGTSGTGTQGTAGTGTQGTSGTGTGTQGTSGTGTQGTAGTGTQGTSGTGTQGTSGTNTGTSTGTGTQGTGTSGAGSSSAGSTTAQPVQPIKVTVEVKAPSWTTTTNIPVTYNTVDIIIKGLVTDKTKVINGIENAEITLIITPQDIYIDSTKSMLQQFLMYKKHYQSPSQSKLITKTGKDGSYQFQFKAIQAYKLKFELQATNVQFDPYDDKSLEDGCLKSITLTKDIQMDRLTMLTKLHSTIVDINKKPVPNAKIVMSNSSPNMKDSKYYNIETKDDDKGSFYLDFQCYKDFEYTVNLSINVPSYVQQTITSSKFKCISALTELDQIQIKLEKIEIKGVFNGKVLDPHGKGYANLQINLITDPVTDTLQTKTGVDGSWQIIDSKIYPNVDYKAIISYMDVNKQTQKMEQKFNIKTDSEAIKTSDINYQDYIDAKINGKIELEKGSIMQPITINLTCPKFKDQAGDINKDYQTDKTGQIDIQFKVLAKFDDKILCTLKTKNIVQETSQNVELVQPNFSNSVTIKSKLITTIFTIQGKLIDSSKVEDKLPGLQVTLTLKPNDQITTAPVKVKSGADGTYTIIAEVLRGITYEGSISVDAEPQFSTTQETLQLLGNQDKQSITKDITLKRNIVDCTIGGNLVDVQQKPINNAQVEILSSQPQIANDKLYNKLVNAPTGQFSLPFQCYNQIQTTLKMDMISDTYPKSQLSPQVFTCGDKNINLKSIVVSAKSVQITISGTITDLSGISKYASPSDVEIAFTPTDPLASTLKTKSDANGKYSLTIGAVQDQVYQILVTITNQDYDKFVSKQTQLTANKDQVLTIDAQLNRIILQATLQSTIIDSSSGKAPPISKLTVEQLQPIVKGTEQTKITTNTDASGKFNFKLSCYKNADTSFILDIVADKYKESKSNKIQFNCNGPTITLPNINQKYELAPTNTKLTINGEIIGPKGKGQSNVIIKITSNPETKPLEVKTGSDGKYSLQDELLSLNTKYILTEQFRDALDQNHQQTQNFITQDEKSTLTFPKTYYDDFVHFIINGDIKSDLVQVANVPVTLQCNGYSKQKTPIDLKTNSDVNGKYKFEWDMLVNINSNIDCLEIAHETPKFKQTSNRFSVSPSKDTITLTSTAEVTEAFQNQLNKYYQSSYVIGSVVAECEQDGKLLWKGLEDVKISLKQFDGYQFVSKDANTVSDKEGLYKLQFQLLKSQIQNELQLEFTKQGYLPSSINFNAYSFQLLQNGQYQITIKQQMVKIGDPDKCQKS